MSRPTTGSAPKRRNMFSAVHTRAMMLVLPLLALDLLVGCGESTVAGPSESLVAAQRVFTVPATITADCSADVTDALQKWFASVPDSSKLVFGTNACYKIDGGLIVADRHNLTFEGNGATFQLFSQGTRDRANWTFKGGSNLTLHNMIARGSNPDAGLAGDAYNTNLEGQHAYRFEGTQTALLDSVQAYDVWGDFVEAEPDWRGAFPGEPVRALTVRNSHFERNGRMGIGLSHVDGFVLQNSYVGNVRWSAIDLELDDDREVGKNILIDADHFGPINHHLFVSKGRGLTGNVGGIVIRNTVMDADATTCLPIVSVAPPNASQFWSDWTIEGNTWHPQLQAWAVQLVRVKNAVVRNNTFIARTHSGCGHNEAIVLSDAHGGSVDGNTLSGNWTVAESADSLTTGFTYSGNVIQ